MEDGKSYLLMWTYIRDGKYHKRWRNPCRNLLEVSSFLYRKEDSSQDQYYGQVLCSSKEDRRTRKIIKNPLISRGFFGLIDSVTLLFPEFSTK